MLKILQSLVIQPGENPLFKEVFYPFGSEADYMSSADQIALFEAMAEQQAKANKVVS